MIFRRGGDSPVGRRRLHPARIATAGVLLPLAIAGALWLSASATIRKALEQGVPTEVAPAAVAMLEIVSLTGTLLWLVGPSSKLRTEAAGATIAASAVSLIAGVSAYGWFGAVAPVALVATVHLASRAWRENWRPAADVTDTPVVETVDTAPAEVAAPDVVEVAAEAPDVVEGDVDEAPAPLPTVLDIDPDTVRRARDLIPAGAGRPTLERELGVTQHKGRALLAALRPLVVLEGGASA